MKFVTFIYIYNSDKNEFFLCNIDGKKSKKNNTKAVTINGVQYESKKDAMEKLGIGRKKLESLINS